jgi:ectoine hydroxylase-related dioxygenase (phytanoyl-CoA dioxygenase family)
MLTQSQIDDFNRDGFLYLPDFLSSAEAINFRKSCFSLFEKKELPGDQNYIRQDLFNRHPEMRWLLDDARIRSVLSSLLGEDFIFMDREASVARNYYTQWHRDTEPPDKAGEKWVWEPDVNLVQVGWYLQENCAEYGGGLEVVPGSHRRREWTAANYKDSEILHGRKRKLARWANKVGLLDRPHGVPYIVPTKPGDLLLFHLRLIHKATYPKVCKTTEMPAHKEKILVSYGASTNNEHPRNYMNFHAKRADKQFISAY